MTSVTLAHAHALMAGAVLGAAYYVLARAMQVAATRLPGRGVIAGVLGGFIVRLFATLGAFWWLLRVTTLPVGALCVGFLAAYNVVFVREVIRQRRTTGASAGRAPQT